MGYIILAVVAVIVVAFFVIVAMQPSDFRIERQASIMAPQEVVFDQVNDFHNWEAWSPWAKMDLEMKKEFLGSTAGAGAIHRWSGNKKVGEGRMTILESHPSDLIRIKLEFLRPFKATNMAEFTFRPVGSETQVKWAMLGKRPFVFKAFCLFMDMDKIVGSDFEKGLAQMKTVGETKIRA
jgi:hypothetical protein